MPDALSINPRDDDALAAPVAGPVRMAMANPPEVPPRGGMMPPGKMNPADALLPMHEPPSERGGAPATKPAKLIPALRYKGKVYGGPSHLDALDAAAAEHGMSPHTLAEHPEVEYGYHSSGQFTHDKNYISPWERPKAAAPQQTSIIANAVRNAAKIIQAQQRGIGTVHIGDIKALLQASGLTARDIDAAILAEAQAGRAALAKTSSVKITDQQKAGKLDLGGDDFYHTVTFK